jgi:hypothetical protein
VATFDWDACDWSEAGRTVVLVGAGGSADLGLPVADELHNQLVERLPPLYANLARLVFADGAPVDVERLFRVIQFLHALETKERPLDQRLSHDGLDIALLVAGWEQSVGEYLAAQRNSVQGSATGRLIDSLWDALFEILWLNAGQPPDIGYLRWLLKSMQGGTIVTLNYDNGLEVAAIQPAAQPVDADPYPRPATAVPGFPDPAHRVRIIKLHGSLNWSTDPVTGTTTVLSDNDLRNRRWASQITPSRPAPGIIFGAGNKLRPDGPYLDMYVEFKKALATADRFVVIGYGWGDAHVNELIRRWLQHRGVAREFRVARVDGPELPSLPRSWVTGNDSVDVSVFRGRAIDTIVEVTRPSPTLQR